jgi:hypothetical protein
LADIPGFEVEHGPGAFVVGFSYTVSFSGMAAGSFGFLEAQDAVEKRAAIAATAQRNFIVSRICDCVGDKGFLSDHDW